MAALHVAVDAPPHVFEDGVGLKLAAPDEGWRDRPDMSPFVHAAYRTQRSRDPRQRSARSCGREGERNALAKLLYTGRMLALACEAGFRKVEHLSAAALAQCYFTHRTDSLRPPNNSEELLVATCRR